MANKSINKTTVVNASKMSDVSSPTSVSSPSTKSAKMKSKWGFRRNKSTKKRSNSSTSSRTASIGMADDETANTKPMAGNEDPSAPSSYYVQAKEAGTKTAGSGLDLVVLLMHPLSHRFELLQLEFDEADRARVSDLLSQIPLSVTEACLKDQLYDSILDQDSADEGTPRVQRSTRLVEAFGHASKMVVVARPQGVSDLAALKMAKPILANKDIANMVRTNTTRLRTRCLPHNLHCEMFVSMYRSYEGNVCSSSDTFLRSFRYQNTE
jgi:hypothetical protein